MQRTLDIVSPVRMGVLRPVPGRDLVVSEDIANPNLSTAGHVLLVVIFTILMIVYTVLTFSWHYSRPDVESYIQLPTSSLPPVNLKITARCSKETLCGDVTISANYTDQSVVAAAAPVSPSSGGDLLRCEGLRTVTYLKEETTDSSTVIVPLCFVQDTVINPQLTTALPIPGIQINFAGINPGTNKATTPHTAQANLTARGEVLIEADDGSFSRLVTMDSWQVKTLLVEQSVTLRDDVLQESSSHAAAIQYEGGRATAWRATLLVQQTAFANSYSSKKSGSLLTVLVGIGGAFYVILALITLLGSLLMCCCPGPLRMKKKAVVQQIKKEKKEMKQQQKTAWQA